MLSRTHDEFPQGPPLQGFVRPSVRWKGADKFRHGDKAQGKFDILDRPKICRYASALRDGQSCSISDQFTHGSFNLVIEILFRDGTCWIGRIRLDDNVTDDQRRLMEIEVTTMRFVRRHSSIPVPEVHAWDTDCDNAFAAPFTLMTGICGWEPDWKTLSVEMKQHVISQMAEIKMKLGSIRFPQIGSLRQDELGNYSIGSLCVGGKWTGPFNSATNYYSYFALSAWEDCATKDYESEASRQNDHFVPWLARSLAPFISHAGLDRGPFPLSHVDLGRHNLLIDDNAVVIGVVDWSNACTLPWESFCNFPVLMGVNWPKKHMYSDWVWQQLMEEQECFLGAVRKLEKEDRFVPKISELIRSDQVRAAEGVESYFNAPWYRDAWCKPMFELIFGDSAEMEKVRDAVCNSFFPICMNVRRE
jgi:Phosphotransferase enzyme family